MFFGDQKQATVMVGKFYFETAAEKSHAKLPSGMFFDHPLGRERPLKLN